MKRPAASGETMGSGSNPDAVVFDGPPPTAPVDRGDSAAIATIAPNYKVMNYASKGAAAIRDHNDPKKRQFCQAGLLLDSASPVVTCVCCSKYFKI